MEEDIGKDESDTRADKVKEGQDHFIAQQVEQNEREGDLRREDVKEPENVDVGTEIDVDENELTDASNTHTFITLKSPERKDATKRSSRSACSSKTFRTNRGVRSTLKAVSCVTSLTTQPTTSTTNAPVRTAQLLLVAAATVQIKFRIACQR